ncbi:ribonuclease P/MRP protein subunit POP8 [Alternaria panax]|uniref:Ribonuclease P/MRP protein subunit POP8 n=1 Tax=Alternaria panax TaxID=48097 RepID=A0AAD4NVE5_9PLEO|nr:ribonuclease P/MRP protein subunit POP8 [Alternaria panax]
MAPIPTQTPSSTSAIPELNTTTSTNAPAPEDADTCMPDATTSTPNAKKRKRKDTALEKHPHILHQTTFRRTAWSYFHLILVTPGTASLPCITTTTSTSTSTSSTRTPPPPSLSPLLASTLLTHPLRAYLGTTGTAIPIDMLKIAGRSIWVRIPRQDARAFRASLIEEEEEASKTIATTDIKTTSLNARRPASQSQYQYQHQWNILMPKNHDRGIRSTKRGTPGREQSN